MGRRTLLLIASIPVAALGTALLWLCVQGADNRAAPAEAPAGAPALGGLPADMVAMPVTPPDPQRLVGRLQRFGLLGANVQKDDGSTVGNVSPGAL